MIDGPFKGLTFARPADYFYSAQQDSPGLTRPALVPDQSAGIGRTLYCLRGLTGGWQVWSSVSD